VIADRKHVLHVARYFSSLSIRRRITYTILITFILILPAVVLSLFYFSGLLDEIEIIIETDFRVGKMANDLSMSMLDIRRYERNYILFGSSAEREKTEQLIAHIDSVLIIIQKIAPDNEEETVRELVDHFTIYSNSFRMLVEHIQQFPPEDRINTIRKKFAQNFSEFLSNYRHILSMLDTVSDAKRDSIIAAASERLDAASFERLFDIESPTEQSGQPSYIRENLEASRAAFLAVAQTLSEQSWQTVLSRKDESRRIEARAKRNILSVLILTGIISIFLITMLPVRIVRPITIFNRVLKKAGTGDFSAQAPVYTHDEIGELAANYNEVMERLRIYDKLKTVKIAAQKRIMDRLLESISIPVCIVTINQVATFYNAAFANMFGPGIPSIPPEGGLNIRYTEGLGQFSDILQENLSSSKNNVFFEVKGHDGALHPFKGRLVRNAVMELESIIIIGITGQI